MRTKRKGKSLVQSINQSFYVFPLNLAASLNVFCRNFNTKWFNSNYINQAQSLCLYFTALFFQFLASYCSLVHCWLIVFIPNQAIFNNTCWSSKVHFKPITGSSLPPSLAGSYKTIIWKSRSGATMISYILERILINCTSSSGCMLLMDRIVFWVNWLIRAP